MSIALYRNLIDACGQSGCPVCRLVSEAVRSYLDHLFYENVNDGGVRNLLRNSLGFCNTHAWQILETGVGNALGIAIIYHDIFHNLLKRWPDPAGGDPSRNGFLDRLGIVSRGFSEFKEKATRAIRPKGKCPACMQRERMTETILSMALEKVNDDELRRALRSSEGICLPHFRQMLERAKGEDDFDFLLSLQREKWGTLRDELAEIIRKNDYRYQAEGYGSERDAWRRALGQAAGEKGMGKDG